MNTNKKIKKAGQAINKASDKLKKLVNKKSAKKKILKQIDKVQQLNEDKIKLQKKVIATVNREKDKANQNKAKTPKNSILTRTAASTNKAEEKQLKKKALAGKTKKKKKPAKKQEVNTNATPKKMVEKAEAKNDTTSTNMNARTAISKISEFSTLQQLEFFIIDEQRKSVLQRASARKKALNASE